MTIKEFEKQAADRVKEYDMRVVDIYSWDEDDLEDYSYAASILAIKNHIVYRYAAFATLEGDVKCKFTNILN